MVISDNLLMESLITDELVKLNPYKIGRVIK